ncbi:hypothetical protein GCM10027047_20230 [Rhodococcus aerolatus]
MTEPDAPQAVVLRISPLALLAVLFTLLAAFPLLLAPPGPWSVLLVVPLLAGVWVLRVRTTVSEAGLAVRSAVGHRHLGWDEVRGIRFRDRGWGRAVLAGDEEVTLPAVRLPDLPVLAAASGGRLPDPAAAREG